jgi:hypothetical protein
MSEIDHSPCREEVLRAEIELLRSYLGQEGKGWLNQHTIDRAEIERLKADDIRLRNRIRKFALLWHVSQADVDRALEGK